MNLLTLSDWSRQRIEQVLSLAVEMKRDPGRRSGDLKGKILLMFFEKPSLRTRLSFEAAMLQLGGHAVNFDLAASPLGKGKETIGDTARTASRYVHGFMARLYRQEDLEELARHSAVPVINGLTDAEHPCQALGDLLTLREKKGDLSKLKLAYVGDGRCNVVHSLMDACGKMGLFLAVACPGGRRYEPDEIVRERAELSARASGGRIEVVRDPKEAVKGSDAVYTDSWMSYHIPPNQRKARVQALKPYRVTRELLAHAGSEAVLMHCLPAERGMELTADVMDGPQSVVFDQAENRLHSAKAILHLLLS